MKKRLWLRSISLIILQCFIFQTICFSMPLGKEQSSTLSPLVNVGTNGFAANFDQLFKVSGFFIDPSVRYNQINERLQANGTGEVVFVAFDRGRKGREVFGIRLPKIDMSRIEDMNLISKYIINEIYNRVAVYGAERILVSASEQVYNAVKAEFDSPVDGNSKKGYHLIGNYCEMVYGKKFRFDRATLAQINDLKEVEKNDVVSNPKQGKIVGIDIGRSDIKGVGVIDGKVFSSDRFDWTPQNLTTTESLLNKIRDSINTIKDSMDKIDAIGISINLGVDDNKPAGMGPVLDGVTQGGVYKNEQFKADIHNMADSFSKEFGVPVYIINDGDAAAVQVSVDMGLPNTLAVSLGSGLAGGYVDANNQVTNWLTEMGNLVIDLSDQAAGHSFSQVKGAAQQYLSQRAVFRLADKLGIELKGESEAEKLRYAQNLFVNGDSDQKLLVKLIFAEVGRYVASFAEVTKSILNEDNLVLFGRVTEGESGEYMLSVAQQIIKEKAIEVNIIFPNIPNLTEEQQKLIQTHGQAIGVAYHASNNLNNTIVVQKNKPRIFVFGGPDGVLIQHSDKRDREFDKSPARDPLLDLLRQGNEVVLVTNQRFNDAPQFNEKGINTRFIRHIPEHLRKNITLFVSNGVFKITFDSAGRPQKKHLFNEGSKISPKVAAQIKKTVNTVIEEYWQEYNKEAGVFKNSYPAFIFKKPEIFEHNYAVNNASSEDNFGLTVSYLPSRQATVTTLGELDDDLREASLKEIQKRLNDLISNFSNSYTIRAAGATSIDIRKKGTGKDHALQEYIITRGLSPTSVSEDMAFIGNLDYYSEDLPLGMVEDINRFRNNEQIADTIIRDMKALGLKDADGTDLSLDKIDNIFPYAGEGVGSTAGWLNEMSKGNITLKELQRRIDSQKARQGIYSVSLQAALTYLDNIKTEVGWKNTSYEQRIEKLYQIYKDYGLAFTDQAAWTVLFRKAFDIKGIMVTALGEVERAFIAADSVEDFFNRVDVVYDKYSEDKQLGVMFDAFYPAIDPRIARNLYFFKEKVFGENSITSLKMHVENSRRFSHKSVSRILTGYFQDNFIYAFKKSGLEDLAKKQNDPMVTYVGGGGVATTTFLRTLVEKDIDSVAALVSSSDDGGSTWTLMLAVLKTFGFFLIPPGDAAGVMIFTGADDAKVFSLFDIEAKKDLPEDLTTAGKRITGKELLPIWKDRIMDVFHVLERPEKIAGLEGTPQDFILFASGLLTLADLIDRELIASKIIELKETSTANLIIMGAAFDKGALKLGKLPGSNSMRLDNLERFLGVTNQRTLPVSFDYGRSCLVVESETGKPEDSVAFQTHITDLVHQNFLTDLRFVNRIKGMDDYREYKDEAHKKEHYRELDLLNKEYPQVNWDVVKALDQTQGIIVMGNGSLFTSLLPNLLYPEIAEAIVNRKKSGLPVAFIVKIKADIETSKNIDIPFKDGKFYIEIGATMSLEQQLKTIVRHMEKAINVYDSNNLQKILGRNKLELSDVMSHIIMPNEAFTEKFGQPEYRSVQLPDQSPAKVDALKKALNAGEAQVSKNVKGFQEISKADRQYILDQGVAIVDVDETDIIGFDNWKPMYNNNRLFDITTQLMNEGFVGRAI